MFAEIKVTLESLERPVGIGQPNVKPKFGIGEGRKDTVVEDDYGIAVVPEMFTDIVSGMDPAKLAAAGGRIGGSSIAGEASRLGLGYAAAGGGRSDTNQRGDEPHLISDGDGDANNDDTLDKDAIEAMDLSEGTGIIRGRNGRPPMKVTTVVRRLDVLAEVAYIPGLEGRVSSDMARQSVKALQPREVVILGGSTSNSDNFDADDDDIDDPVGSLAKAAQSAATGSKKIFTPYDGETVEIPVGHAAYPVRLVDTPYLSAAEKRTVSKLPDPIESKEIKLGGCYVSVVDGIATGQKVAADGSIVVAPRNKTTASTTSYENDNGVILVEPSLHVSDGEVLLPNLRAELAGHGMKVVYSTHPGYAQLVVNGKIVVQSRNASDSLNETQQRLSVEGPLCEDFYKVRSIVCKQYVTL